MMLSSVQLIGCVDTDWKPRRSSSPLDSWSPAASDVGPQSFRQMRRFPTFGARALNLKALSEEGPLVKLSFLGSPPRCCSRTDAHLFLGVDRTPCRWELSRLLNSIRGRQAAKAKRELAGTEVAAVERGEGLKGSLRESMCQAAIRILRATAALAELWLRERRLTARESWCQGFDSRQACWAA